jgi:poly(A) polymerase
MKYELYEVGGKIRDEFLGIPSKDVDYSVVLTEPSAFTSALNAFYVFRDELLMEGFDVVVETPSTLTIRAIFPKEHKYSGVADFVIARKELFYQKGTREPYVEIGSLLDDMRRRDFTVNALAKSSSGEIVDMFGGEKDLIDRILRTPVDASISFSDDPLRILRAMRFKITKGFSFSDEIVNAIMLFRPLDMETVSNERIREELHKMFKHDTKETLAMLRWLYVSNSALYDKLLSGGMWLMPTTKQ